MARNTDTIFIDSILGGHSPSTNFSASDQFRASLGINPSYPINDEEYLDTLGSGKELGSSASGLLRPTSFVDADTGGVLQEAVTRLLSTPKTAHYFAFDENGSAYTIATTGVPTALSDGGSLTGATYCDAAYYDNYVYFSKATTIARYGPLDGTPAFDGNYWAGTLGKTQLTDYIGNNDYHVIDILATVNYPMHLMHRHSDGRLYITDVVDGKGTLHYIQTTKTTVEGDTDDGSTYNTLQFGYRLIPTALESYGSDIVVALYEHKRITSGSVRHVGRERPAKVAFWDTVSQQPNRLTWVEFPDPFISAMKNVNGVLYTASGNAEGAGFRISRYIGGHTFEEVAYIETGSPPMPGAMTGSGNNLLFGSSTVFPTSAGCVYSLGLQRSRLADGSLFNIARISNTNQFGNVSSLLESSRNQDTFAFKELLIGWATITDEGLDVRSETYGTAPSVWWSQMYRIGRPFRIHSIRIPFAQKIAANMTVVAKVYTDDGAGETYTLQTINNTNFSGKKSVKLRSDSSSNPIVGDHNFWVELTWSGTALCVVGLPIIIEYELTDDE